MKFFLIGFMGSGKTYFGSRWAAASGLAFYDLDFLIEKEAGMPIKEIFETEGEDYFRAKETSVLRALEEVDEAMIACGGGTPCFNENMSWMNVHGQTIYLQATPEYLLKNLENDGQSRPLLKTDSGNNKKDKIQALLSQRKKYYEQAMHIIDMSTDPGTQFQKIIDLYA